MSTCKLILMLVAAASGYAWAETYVYKDIVSGDHVAFFGDAKEVVVAGTSYEAEPCFASEVGVCVLAEEDFVIVGGKAGGSPLPHHVEQLSVIFSEREFLLGQHLELYKAQYKISDDTWTTLYSVDRGLVAFSVRSEGGTSLYILKGRCGLGHRNCDAR